MPPALFAVAILEIGSRFYAWATMPAFVNNLDEYI
jgi:hypothetical protein